MVERGPQEEKGKGEKIGKGRQVLISSSFEFLRFVIGLENGLGFYYGKSGDRFVGKEILNCFDQPREKLGKYISRLLKGHCHEVFCCFRSSLC